MEKENKKAVRPGRNDSAVSPVVGVMLMLVVTIVVAAVVASFASGIGGSSEKAPTSTLDVSVYGGSTDSAVIKNIAGDNLETKDLLITVSYTIPLMYNKNPVNKGGQAITHIIDGSLEPIADNDLKTDAENYPYEPQTTNNDAEVSKRVNGKEKFGEADLVSGSQISFDLNYFAGFDTNAAPALYGFLPHNAVFHVTVMHKPSGTVLFDDNVRMS